MSTARNRDMACHTCGGKGHFKRDCPNRKVMIINEDNEYETGDDVDPNAPKDDDYDTDGEDAYPSDARTIVVSQRALNVLPSASTQRCNLFKTKALVGPDKACKVIIDGGSCRNLASKELCTKLKLKYLPHTHPYYIQWLSDNGEMKVNHMVRVEFEEFGDVFLEEVPAGLPPLRAQDHAFDELKRLLTSAPLLALPDFNKQFEIECDASGIGIGGVLMQEGRPIAYFSEKLSGAKLNYPIYDKELYALIRVLEILCDLYATDHDFAEPYRLCALGKAWEKYHIHDGFLFRANKLCVPESSVRLLLLQESHAGGLMGHFGREKTLLMLADHFYWPKMRRDMDRVNMEASKRADFVRKIHVKTKELIEKKGKSNAARMNKKRKEILFKPGDMVWSIDLPVDEFGVSNSFNVADLTPYDGEDLGASRSTPFEGGRDDEDIPTSLLPPSLQEDDSAVKLKSNEVRIGPMTRARMKRNQASHEEERSSWTEDGREAGHGAGHEDIPWTREGGAGGMRERRRCSSRRQDRSTGRTAGPPGPRAGSTGPHAGSIRFQPDF
ncbi:hypothetical protein QYE76_046755 [Lolium multiflorum]|uniref:CCHC-type domain-containing protein n=1 Tax=Lolium multiflorum TaxID=4521 RepID=A0AAD8WYN3_LOLMU|nr:hypothetical protein QYE76_046755 [Lolium multiflorum]